MGDRKGNSFVTICALWHGQTALSQAPPMIQPKPSHQEVGYHWGERAQDVEAEERESRNGSCVQNKVLDLER